MPVYPSTAVAVAPQPCCHSEEQKKRKALLASLSDIAEQLSLEDKLALLVFL